MKVMKARTVLTVLLLLVYGLHARPDAVGQTPTPTPGPQYAAAEAAFAEAVNLFAKHTPESMRAALEMAEKARRLFNEASAPTDEALALSLLGYLNIDLGDKRAALRNIEQSLTIVRKIPNKELEASTLSKIGALHEDLDEPQKALEAYDRALPLYKELGDKKGEAATLKSLARVSRTLGERQKTLDYLIRALPLFRELGDKESAAVALGNVGTMYAEMGERRKAMEYFNQALPLIKELGDKGEEATILYNLSRLYKAAGDKQKAVDCLSRSLLLYRGVGDRDGEAAALKDLGITHADSDEPQKALEYFKQALPLVSAAGDTDEEAMLLLHIGRAYKAAGERQGALEHFNRALALYKAAGDKKGESVTLNNIGMAYAETGERRKALEYYNQSLPLRRSAGDKGGEGTTLDLIGDVYGKLGDKQKALEYYGQALPLRNAAGDKHGEADTLISLGLLYDSLDDKQRALDFYGQALKLNAETGDTDGEATILSNIGMIYTVLGEYEKALENLNKALSLRRPGDNEGRMMTLNNIGMVYVGLGEWQQAIDYIGKALQLARARGSDKELGGTMLTNIGIAYAQAGEAEKAVDAFSQALRLSREVGDKDVEARSLNALGAIFDLVGDRAKALEYLNQALPLRRLVGDKSGEASTLFVLARVYLGANEHQKSLEYLSQALVLQRVAGDKDSEAMTLDGLAHVYSILNKPQLAIFFGKLSVNCYQDLRGAIRGIDIQNQQSFLRSIEDPFRNLASRLLDEGRVAEAHQILNILKNQEFFDATRQTRSAGTQVNVTEFTRREKEAADLYQAAMTRLTSANRPLLDLEFQLKSRTPTADDERQLKQLRAQFEEASGAAAAVPRKIEANFTQPAAAEEKLATTSDTAEMQAALRELSEQTGSPTVALYTIGGGGKFYVLLVTPDHLTSVSNKVPDVKFIGEIIGNPRAGQDGLWRLLQSPDYDPCPQSRQIYNIVFKPIEAQIRQFEAAARKQNPGAVMTLMWSLDWYLRYVPMGALYDGERYLAERYRNVVFTRANKERMTRPVSARWDGLGFGSTAPQTVRIANEEKSYDPLPGAGRELAMVFGTWRRPGLMPGQTWLNEQFTKEAFLTALKQGKPLVHIASHFSFEPGDDARSFLLLGSGEVMTLGEMKAWAGLFAGVDLLTLSACNTGAQQFGAYGREIDGFAELAQRLGASAVLATLWPVPDATTPGLIQEFYRLRQGRRGMTKAEALQQAQLSLLHGRVNVIPLSTAEERSIKQNRERADILGLKEKPVSAPRYQPGKKAPFSHPYYWAGFVLIGNSR